MAASTQRHCEACGRWVGNPDRRCRRAACRPALVVDLSSIGVEPLVPIGYKIRIWGWRR